MRIQHNITALNAANRLKSNESTVAKNIQKLSSGYRINSAADDAAGLAVSEKMREQISGLTQAEDNTKNGISLVQTAEGGLNETSAILQRMNTLATESANGTYKNEDRGNLQLEVTHLKTEIDRIANSTKFNEISLLDGSLSANGSASITTSLTPTTTPAAKAKAVIGGWDLTDLANDNDNVTYTVNYTDATGASKTATAKLTLDKTGNKLTDDKGVETTTVGAPSVANIGDALYKNFSANTSLTDLFTVTKDSSGNITFEAKTAGLGKGAVTSITTSDSKNPSSSTITPATDEVTNFSFSSQTVFDSAAPTSAKSAVFDINGKKFAFAKAGTTDAQIKASLGADVNAVVLTGASVGNTDVSNLATAINAKTGLTATPSGTNITLTAATGKALVFQVGAENSDDQRAQLNIDNMNSSSLGLKDLDISTQDGANAAIDIIKSAIATVSTTRAQLGGLQNELEHTANNLGTMNENLTSAESTIRDVDMTDEYVQFSKNQILSQAANAMLAQANTQPQNVLSLLKG